MPRTVTYRVGLVGWDEQKRDAAGVEQDLTVEIHELDAEPWGIDRPFRHVGTDVPRLDGAVKATGTARYTYDAQPEGLCFAGLVTSPHAHADIVTVDTAQAEAMAGVLAVERYAQGRVTYAGKIVAAVCAESETVLSDALAAVKVTYAPKPGPAVTDDAMQPGSVAVDPRRESNVEPPRRPVLRGKPDEVFADAEVVVEATYRTPIQTHSCLEPHGCTCQVHEDGSATVWASTQAVSFFASRALTDALGVAPNKVRVITQHMGGGFGSKFSALEWDVICAAFARKTRRPVRMMLSRRLEHLLGGNRPDSIQRMALAGGRDGSILGLKGETWGTSGNSTGGGAGAANFMVYELPHLDMRQNSVATFSGHGRAFRAPRHPQGVFALESVLERYAYAAGVDALAVRMKNDRHPIRQVQWRIGAERIGWARHRRRVPGSDKGSIKRGVGCAASRWGQAGRHVVGRSPLVFDVFVDRGGGIAFQNAVQDLGTGTRTVIAVLAAEELGLRPQQIEVRIGDSRYAPGPGSGGSTTTPSIGPAVRNGALRVKESLAGLLALEWGVEQATLHWADGVCHGPGGKQASFAQACSLLGPDGLRVQGERMRNWNSPFRETAGCQFAQVAVDTETGVISVEKIVAVHDCGVVVDALTARSQVNGGVIQGISYALYEEKRTDRNLGDMVNPTLDTYKIMGMADCPPIDVLLTSVVSGYNNAGLMGLGEPATVPAAGAVANAVYNAIGVQMTELPMTPARVLRALEGGAR